MVFYVGGVPVEFLSDEQAAGYGRFPGSLERAELERYFFLDDADRVLVGRRRGDANRLGYAVQLGTLRALGGFLADPVAVPVEVVDFVAAQLAVVDPSCVKSYAKRDKTRLEHQWDIAHEFGFSDLGERQVELVGWLSDRAWTTGDGPRAMFDGAVVWLRERRVLLPGVTVLARLVARVRDDTMQRLWDVLAGLVTPAQSDGLIGLLEVPAGERDSALERLRHGPTTVSGSGLVNALRRVEEIAELQVGTVPPGLVPRRRVVELARWGMAAKTPALRRHPVGRKVATLFATVVFLGAKATDDALELFDVLMTTDLLARADRDSQAARLGIFDAVARDGSTCAAAIRALFSVSDSGGDLTIESLWAAIDRVVSRDELRAAAINLAELVPAPDLDPAGEWRASLLGRFASVRGFLAMLTSVIRFEATTDAADVLAAMEQLPSLLATNASRRIPTGWLDAEHVPAVVVPAGWRPLVFPADRPAGCVDRAAYVFCLLEQFHRFLKRREVYASASSRWGDPRAQLLSGAAWDVARGPALNALQLPTEPDSFLADRADDLDAAWRNVAGTLDTTTAAEIDADGRFHLERINAVVDPASLTELRRRCRAMLPRIDIGELILDVKGWLPQFLAAFTAASGGDARLDGLDVTIAAALTAQALNVGYTPVVSDDAALTRARISHVDQNYLRAENFAGANTPLIDAQADVALAQAWGGGLVAAVDGMRFVVPVRTIDARPNPKYFGRRRGVTWLNMITDQAIGIADRVLSGTPRDSLHLIDLIYSQDSGRRPEVIVTDTGSYSDIVFGLLHLLGFDYRPQLADLPDAKLWRVDPAADYGPLNQTARGRIDLARVRRHWPDIIRVVASIHTGTVSAYDIIRVLQRDGRPTPLGEAIAHYGRIFKTTHVLAYASDEAYRQQIKHIRNRQEGRHDLARHTFHGRKGEVRHGYREGMEDQLGALGLVLNCVTLWNTVYLDTIISVIRAGGENVDDNDIARLSAYMRKHINFAGHYTFQRHTASSRRPLHHPDDTVDQDND